MDNLTWLYFTIACSGLAMTPGPNSLLVMTHSVRFGPALTFYTISGGLISFVLLMIISMFGIDALLQSYPSLLGYIKVAGGIYIVWLGLKQFLLTKLNLSDNASFIYPINRISLFTQGAASAGSDPKVFLIFGAFLTPFIDISRDIALQFISMAITLSAAKFLIELFISFNAVKYRSFLVRNGKKFNVICGSVFILTGASVLSIN